MCFCFGFRCCLFYWGSFVVVFVMFIWWFFFPIGFLLLLDVNFSLIFLLGIFFVGCFLFSSCFIYLATMRTLFFGILNESIFLFLFLLCYFMDVLSFFSVRDLCVDQLFVINFWIGGVFFGLFWISMLLDGLRLPFDYMECESELVAGVITEFSGIFFVLYSVMEINHLLMATLLMTSLIFGGIFVCFRSILILTFCFLTPRTIGFRLKITTAQYFIVFFLISCCLLLGLWLILMKILVLSF